MTAREDGRDPVIASLSQLQVHEPDPVRAARLRAQGRAAMAAQARRHPGPDRRAPRFGWRVALEPMLVAGACAVFLLEVFSRATRLYR